jgi:hypothetical protein
LKGEKMILQIFETQRIEIFIEVNLVRFNEDNTIFETESKLYPARDIERIYLLSGGIVIAAYTSDGEKFIAE